MKLGIMIPKKPADTDEPADLKCRMGALQKNYLATGIMTL